MSAHPLLQRLLDEFGYPLLTTASHEAFVRSHEYSVLFFSEDPNKIRESLDVAVVLPELQAAFPQLAAALIDRDAEQALQARYFFVTWPALVFLKRGDFLGTIIRIQNWDDYLQQITEILARQPQPVESVTPV
jgi:hydrogenase-1 operon protein HyaE